MYPSLCVCVCVVSLYVCSWFNKLGSDDTPMVRRAAAGKLGVSAVCVRVRACCCVCVLLCECLLACLHICVPCVCCVVTPPPPPPPPPPPSSLHLRSLQRLWSLRTSNRISFLSSTTWLEMNRYTGHCSRRTNLL